MAMAPLIDAYLAGVPAVRQAVADMSRAQLVARPVTGKWSTLEVVCHLADFEPIYADRMKRIIAEDQPLLFSADEKRFASSLAYQERDIEEELAIIDQTRRQLARILRTLPEESFARVGIYRYEGHDEPRTLERFVTLITNHIHHHLKFVYEKRRALGLTAQ